MNEATLRVRVQLKEADLLGLVEYVHARLGVEYRTSLQYFIWLLFMPAIPLLVHAIISEPITLPVVMSAAVLFAMGVQIVRNYHRVRHRTHEGWLQTADARFHLMPRDVEIGPEGVRTSSAMSSAHYAWPLISEIVRNRECIYLLIGDGQGIVIPDRAFASEHDRDVFMMTAEGFRHEAMGGVTRCPQCQYDLRGDPMHGCPECGWRRRADVDAERPAHARD